MTTELRIDGGEVLIDGAFVEADIALDGAGRIDGVGTDRPVPRRLDARGLKVLPGIVDIHGDAFERQMMPRPGVDFPHDVALLDTDRQVVANGITTVFHGVTWSWEPGLRGADNARDILATMERLQPKLAADTRFHLRHETYNLDAEAEISDWLAQRRIGVLAFNDHMTSIVQAPDRAKKLAPMVERSGLSAAAFEELVARTVRRVNEVPGSIERLAAAAARHGVPMLSHDDTSPEQRGWYRSLGCRMAEFPTNIDTGDAASEAGDDIVFGAPNVVRGGSHTGWVSAADMIARGCCSILASDYYYPASLLAPFRLDADGVLPLAKAWALVSERPAAGVGLEDRGQVRDGLRGDLILVDATNERRPQVVATLVCGRVVYLCDASRLSVS
jgi:alpha-D-ribose 1-methylphosphonate 5-triphosphate diphosphatase